MECKQPDQKTTPNSKANTLLGKVINHCDSPMRFLPNFSTPPSRFPRIRNPFEAHIIERLHLPTFSPSVFAGQSASKKTEEKKFRWDIEDLSWISPVDIDEASVHHHVHEEDPAIERFLQDKIHKFFEDKPIVPSPMGNAVEPAPVPSLLDAINKSFSDGSSQTELTLPPVLPKHIEDILKPFFTYTHDQQKNDDKFNTLHRNLFEQSVSSRESSPAQSHGLSPIQLSPTNSLEELQANHSMEEPNLQELNFSLSPIRGEARSVCRLDFSGRMSVDISSMLVPDVNNQMASEQTHYLDDSAPMQSVHEMLSDSSTHWDMEFRRIASPESCDFQLMDISNANTPKSKQFTSQRKRLSDSFLVFSQDDPENSENAVPLNPNREQLTDTGYQTSDSWELTTHFFSSTPSKRQHQT